MIEPKESLDEYNFTKLDLLVHKGISTVASLVDGSVARWWNVPLCRGCTYECKACGGSSFSYPFLFGRRNIAFRSPVKIVEDLQSLVDQGVKQVFLFQDPRMGGERYWSELFNAIRREKPQLNFLGMELFTPANKEYLIEMKKMDIPLVLNISPESGCEEVRAAHGRAYSNSSLLETIKLCRELEIRLGVFFMIGLGLDTPKTISETLILSEKIYAFDRANRSGSHEQAIKDPLWVKPEVGMMILLDPGSLAYEFPEMYGYKLHFRNVEDYYRGMSLPSWHQWLSYETKYMSKNELIEYGLYSLERIIHLQEKYGLYASSLEKAVLDAMRFRLRVEKIIIKEVDRIYTVYTEKSEEQLMALKLAIERYLEKGAELETARMKNGDPYDYIRLVRETVHESTGLFYECS